MMGTWTLSKQRTFLYLAISVLIANVINLVLLEVGEWHFLLPESAKKLIEQGNLKMLVLYARTITSLSTVVAAVIAFIDSQLTFCSMQYHEKYHKKEPEKQEVLSDTEYVLPRVKSDSDENDNAGYYNKQYPQSWVYETQTAETSTISSVPNRFSGTSSDNAIDLKPTSSETEFKDISTHNLNMEQPIVVVENTADYTDRQLHYMTSFSRTPSPVPASESSSEDLHSNGHLVQEITDKFSDSSACRPRHNSTLSASTVSRDQPFSTVSPRPPSISGIDQLQQELLKADLQDTVSQKSFKISADQIFIPLKDEIVIRVKDEVFVIPKSPRISPAPEAEKMQTSASSETKQTCVDMNPQPESEIASTSVSTPTPVVIEKESDKVDISLFLLSQVEAKLDIPPKMERPSLPEIVHALHKESRTSPREIQPKYPSSPKESQLENRKPSLQNVVEQYLSSSACESELVLVNEKSDSIPSPTDSDTISSPVLERQDQFERQNTVIAKDITLPSPVLERQPKFDRQDTVVEQKPCMPSPVQERQSQIERQDAILSPREDQSFEPPSFELEAVDTLVHETAKEDVELSDSNNSSTDKETIEYLSNNGKCAGTLAQDKNENISPCDTPDLIEGIMLQSNSEFGNKIDNIFRIAEDPRIEERDREDAKLFDTEKQTSDIPLTEMDAAMFSNIPPPEETDETNGVDPDEWEESDDDSIDSSCVRRVPPPSTMND